MKQNPDFYSTAAAVIPFLLIATVLEERLRPKQDPLALYPMLRLIAAVTFVVAEAIALDSLADREYTATRERMIGLTVAIGLALVVVAMVPAPVRERHNRKRLFEGLDEARRERIGHTSQVGLVVLTLVGLVALLVLDP